MYGEAAGIIEITGRKELVLGASLKRWLKGQISATSKTGKWQCSIHQSLHQHSNALRSVTQPPTGIARTGNIPCVISF